MNILKRFAFENKIKKFIVSSLICFIYNNYACANDNVIEEGPVLEPLLSSSPDQSNPVQLHIAEMLASALPLLQEIDKSLALTSQILIESKEMLGKVTISLDYLTDRLSHLSKDLKHSKNLKG